MNPRAAVNDLHPFQGCPFGQLGYFSVSSTAAQIIHHVMLYDIDIEKEFFRILFNGVTTERRGWDSNPCALADKRFSRPPRYDHFDTSPYVVFAVCISARPILPSQRSYVNNYFQFFCNFFFNSAKKLPQSVNRPVL